jgi:hypothetical protein
MTLHLVGEGGCGVVSPISISLSISDWNGGAESRHDNKRPPSLISSSSMTKGVEEDAIFFDACFSKSCAIWLFPFISTLKLSYVH